MFIQHLGARWKERFSILADSIEEKAGTKLDNLNLWGDLKGWGGGTLLQTGSSINLAFWYIKLFLFLGLRVQLQTGERKWSLILHSSRAGLWWQVFCISVEISNFPGAYSFPTWINNSIPSDFVTGPFSLGCFPSLCFWFISFHHSCPLPDLLPPAGLFLFFCSLELRLFSHLFPFV